MSRLVLALLAILALGPAPGLAAEGKVPVVASFSILADFVREVGGDRVEVSALVGPDADLHSFQPSPADARRLKEARLVVVNGLGLEGWMDRLVRSSGTKAAAVLTASTGVSPLKEGAQGGHAHDGHAHDVDPHAWQDVANAKLYVAKIRDGLVRIDPEGRPAYEANAARYLAQLDELDRDIRTGLAAIQPGRREVISTHEAFGYFTRAYGIAFTAPQGVSAGGEPSAADVARIIRQIRAKKIPAVFLENVSDGRLAARIAAEGGARLGGRLYSDALAAPGEPAASYIGMMRHNLAALLSALTSG